jgi:hypothetical protein
MGLSFENKSSYGLESFRISNGYAIRQLKTNLVASFEDVFMGIKGLFPVGIELVGDTIVLDDIVHIVASVDYDLEPMAKRYTYRLNRDWVYSRVLFGYNKWESDLVQSLDEYNTFRSYKTEYSDAHNEADMRSNFIASHYIAEQLRRLGGSTRESNQHDEALFIFHTDNGAVANCIFENIIGTLENRAINTYISPRSNAKRWSNLIVGDLIFEYGSGNEDVFIDGSQESDSIVNSKHVFSCLEAEYSIEPSDVSVVNSYNGTVSMVEFLPDAPTDTGTIDLSKITKWVLA